MLNREKQPLKSNLRELLSRYRIVMIPLILALLLDGGLLAFNSMLSVRLEALVGLINVVGHQRMLSQRMTKALAQAYYLRETGQHYQAVSQEFFFSAQAFDRTLRALVSGKEVRDLNGHMITVTALDQAETRLILQQAMSIWEPLHDGTILAQKMGLKGESLNHLLEDLQQQNVVLLELMNDLTSHLEVEAESDSRTIRYGQMFIVLTIFVLFILSMYRMKRSEDYFSALMESGSDIVLSLDMHTKQITFINKAVEISLGHADHYYLLRSYQRLFTRKSCRTLDTLMSEVLDGQVLHEKRIEAEIIQSSGEVLTADCVLKVAYSDDGEPRELLIDIRDITERKRYEQELKHLAHTDGLTGLTNRNLFFDFARQALARAERKEVSVAVLFIDLDGFKAVNDNYGHEVGDRLLQILAKELMKCFRKSDIVARLGGDEFVVLIENVERRDVLVSICEKVIAQVSQTFFIKGHECRVGASIGIAVFPEDGDNIESLVTRADEAMYRVKGSGGSAVGFSEKQAS